MNTANQLTIFPRFSSQRNNQFYSSLSSTLYRLIVTQYKHANSNHQKDIWLFSHTGNENDDWRKMAVTCTPWGTNLHHWFLDLKIFPKRNFGSTSDKFESTESMNRESSPPYLHGKKFIRFSDIILYPWIINGETNWNILCDNNNDLWRGRWREIAFWVCPRIANDTVSHYFSSR